MTAILVGLIGSGTVLSVLAAGYLAARRQRQHRAEEMLELASKLDQASALIAKVKSVSDDLRRVMATHHSALAEYRDQIQVLHDKQFLDLDPAHHMHLQEALKPTQRLSDDIAHAYDELRQHTWALQQLRHQHQHDSAPRTGRAERVRHCVEVPELGHSQGTLVHGADGRHDTVGRTES